MVNFGANLDPVGTICAHVEALRLRMTLRGVLPNPRGMWSMLTMLSMTVLR